jgi:5-(carboxyamino)imidazole ribonucleotide synthase
MSNRPTTAALRQASTPAPGADGDHPVLHPQASLGVIGSGQLGRMFLRAAQRMGYQAGVLSTTEDAPAAQIASWTVVGACDDTAALRAFCRKAEAVTVEFENVSAAALRWLARRRPVRPGWRTVWTSQNRLREKTFLTRCAIPHAPWRPVRTDAELARAVEDLGLPLILKTASSGYDGKGQVLVDREADAAGAWDSLERVTCVAEAWVEFAVEVSVVVARGRDGEAVAYPVGLNHHERHILDSTMMPAPVGPVVSQEARTLALAVAQALGTVGVLCVEFFLTAKGRLLVNEIAPRPHNSGHLTIEAAYSSQFEQQVRALCGLPLGRGNLIMPAAMVNLMGDLWEHGEPRWDAALRSDPGVKLHLYGKDAAEPGRKMGHLTVLDPDPEAARARALAARRALIPRN